MNRNRVSFVFIIIFFLNCDKDILETNKYFSLSKETLSAAESNESSNYAYVINPNGISLYEKPFELDSKISTIPYGARMIITFEEIPTETNEANRWTSVAYKGKKGFVFSTEPYNGFDFLVLSFQTAFNDKTNVSEPAYSITQKKTTLYKLPSLDSESIADIEPFALVHVLGSANVYDSFINNNIDLELGRNERVWYEVKVGNDHGFILNSINYLSPKTLAEEQVKNQIVFERGFFLLQTESPTLYDMDTKEPLTKEYEYKIVKQNFFTDSTESRILNGEQVYLISLGDNVKLTLKKEAKKKEKDFLPYAAYILGKDGIYFTEKKFSDYSVANTSFKGDMNAITIVRNEFEKRGIYLNYLNFSLKKISGERFPQNSFFIASAHADYFDKNSPESKNLRSIVLKQTDGIYEPISGSIYTNNSIQFKDLDKDGILEMIVKTPTRGGDETVIYGLKDGRYISMNSLLYAMSIYEIELKGNRISGKKWVSATEEKSEKTETKYFKYENASFVELKK